ncbi:MAG: ABC transporter permease [Candidatus Omnitrophica bacterium]|nr:ABC transporter permease [Candidatus Omnitrophota bacterium]
MRNLNKLTVFGIIVVAIMAAAALFAPLISEYDPGEIDLRNALMPPSSEHIMGTDSLGRDLFSRMAFGARISLSVGFVAVGISVIAGVIFGSVAGYYGGWVDSAISRFIDIMLCFPTFFLILATIAVLGPGIWNIMVIIGLTGWMGVARLIRAEILSLKEREFVEAARAVGASDFRIITRHLIPNGLGPVLVSATLGVAGAILTESGLSFLGLGVQPPVPSWGNILTEAKSTLGIAWWITVFPGLAILITVLGYNLLGEGLREHFNPHRRQ